MTGAFLSPIDTVLSRHRLKLLDAPVQRVAAHCFELFVAGFMGK